jgi:hypothetical protein
MCGESVHRAIQLGDIDVPAVTGHFGGNAAASLARNAYGEENFQARGIFLHAHSAHDLNIV